jgi:hypothetical protein
MEVIKKNGTNKYMPSYAERSELEGGVGVPPPGNDAPAKPPSEESK